VAHLGRWSPRGARDQLQLRHVLKTHETLLKDRFIS
jgi:hypothetical protein